jgi:hypothetical protein
MFANAEDSAKPLAVHYILNDPVKARELTGAVAIISTTSMQSVMENTWAEDICRNKVNIVKVAPDALTVPKGSIMDFGPEIQNFSSSNLYAMFSDTQIGQVGYGYLFSPLGDCSNAQPICLGPKNIGLIRQFSFNDVSGLAVKLGTKRWGFKYYDYLSSGFSQVLTNPDPSKYPYNLELHQVESFNLINCVIRRYKVVKVPHVTSCFDKYMGDEIFVSDGSMDVLNNNLLKGGLDAAEANAHRDIARKLAVENSSVHVKVADTEVIEDRQSVVLRRKRPGRIFDYYEDIVASTKRLNIDQVYATVDRKVVNKVTLNFMNAPQLTKELVKSNLGYINNCCPNIDILNEGMAVLMYSIKETACAEALLLSALKSNDSELITALKAGGFDVAPSSLKEAWRRGMLFDYLGCKIRTMFGLKVEEIVNPKDTTLGF